jgi:RNA polymerase sigma-70 factor (family 1)
LSDTHVYTDNHLLSDLVRGDEDAFRQVYQKYHKPLYFIAVRYLKEPSLAEDAVQEVFVKLWINRLNLNGQLSLKGFLFTTLKNHVLNVIRHYKVLISQNATASYVTDRQYEWEEYTHLVEAGIEKLSPQRREIFRLRTFDGLDNAQVADRLGLSINTVKFQFSQASKFMREFLKNQADS